MNEYDNLLRAMNENPAESGNLGVFADLLDEQGRPGQHFARESMRAKLADRRWNDSLDEDIRDLHRGEWYEQVQQDGTNGNGKPGESVMRFVERPGNRVRPYSPIYALIRHLPDIEDSGRRGSFE